MAGLCGLGDLVLTCSSPQSRNMSVGLALGRGETLRAGPGRQAVGGRGRRLARRPCATLAASSGVETPICEAVAAILAGEIGVDDAIDGLLSRPLKAEGE